MTGRAGHGHGLRTGLLEYYLSCGWSQSPPAEGRSRIRRVLLAAAARGDARGVSYLIDGAAAEDPGGCSLDKDVCAAAGAAGRLELLRWLRETRGCPWDPAEVYWEASENLHGDVMDYVEMNSEGQSIDLVYGPGMPC